MLRRPPTTEFEIDRHSPQAAGLVFCVPLLNNNAVDLISGIVPTRSAPIAPVSTTRGQALDFPNGPYLLWTMRPVSIYPLTFTAWFNSDTIAATDHLLSMGPPAGGEMFELAAAGAATGDPVRALVTGGGIQTQVSTTTGYSVGVWHLATAVFAANNNRSVYIDAGSKATATGTRNVDFNALTTVRIAASVAGGNNFDGRIVDVRIYNRALSDAEVQAIYRNPWDLYAPVFKWWIIPSLSAVIHAVTGKGVTATPTLGKPNVGQRHALQATGIAAGAVVGQPSLAQRHALQATGIAATPTLGKPNVGQRHALSANGIAATPTLGQPSVAQRQALSANGIVAGAVVGNPDLAQRHALQATAITATPVLGQPESHQAHVLTATGITTTPSLGAPLVSTEGTHSVGATGITATPTLGNPFVSQRHALTATGITAAPTLGHPSAVQNVALEGGEIVAMPTLGNPDIAQRHVLRATGITASPDLGKPSTAAPDALQALGIVATPTLGNPFVGQAHVLQATGITAGAVVGHPVLDFVAPVDRVYVVPFENRVYVVPFENRVYEV